jgi:probable rRNA maturation factor
LSPKKPPCQFILDGVKIPRQPFLQKLAAKVMVGEGLEEVHVIFTDDAHVRDLNGRFRGLDKVTDVLSFPDGEDGFSGEIYIAMGLTELQAPRYGNTLYQELRRLLVHGLLHLAGYDHMKTGERLRMRTRENHYLGVTSPSSGL